MANPDGAVSDRRRFVVGAAGAVAGAGLSTLAWPSSTTAGSSRVTTSAPLPPPNPIPGGAFDVGPPLGVIHVFVPGDPSVTLPFTGATLGGFDVEPGTVNGLQGLERRRVSRRYCNRQRRQDVQPRDGHPRVRGRSTSSTALRTEARSPSYESMSRTPGRGRSCTTSTAASFRPASSGRSMFGNRSVDFRMNNRRTVLQVRNLPVIDTFQVLRAERHCQPSSTSAPNGRRAGPAVPRGSGDAVDPDRSGRVPRRHRSGRLADHVLRRGVRLRVQVGPGREHVAARVGVRSEPSETAA